MDKAKEERSEMFQRFAVDLPAMNKAIFLDKDGTLIHDIPYNVSPQFITLTGNAIPALQQWQQQKYLLIIVSNQSGVARGFFEEKALEIVSETIAGLLSEAGIVIDGFYYCPHYENGIVPAYSFACDCRKPLPGLILQAAKDFDIDVAYSWMIGDTLTDTEAGRAAGCQTILINNVDKSLPVTNTKNKPDHIAANLLEAAQVVAANT